MVFEVKSNLADKGVDGRVELNVGGAGIYFLRTNLD
jgi:hypothetical protein